MGPGPWPALRDLGLVAPDPPLRIANPIYGEVLPRELTRVLQAFPHRLVNATGGTEREYALGGRRVDLLVIWPAGQGREERSVGECRPLRSGRARSIGKGLEQTAAYMDLSGTSVGRLVVFDMRGGRNWAERVFREEHTHDGKRITVWGA